MSRISQTHLTPLGHGRWQLENCVTFHLFFGMVQVDVPAGFVTDGASIPRLLWTFVGHPLTGEFQDASVVHDWLCERSMAVQDYSLRMTADAIFFHLLGLRDVPRWKRSLMYCGVRWHGFFAFGGFRAWFNSNLTPSHGRVSMENEMDCPDCGKSVINCRCGGGE